MYGKLRVLLEKVVICGILTVRKNKYRAVNMESCNFKPIGKIKSDAVYTQETPRQGAFSRRSAVIELEKWCDPEHSLKDLDGVTHIWIIWVFDRVENWKSLVHPPTACRKVGVFATRSPHRPNPIGITCARLVKVENNRLYIENSDLLDGTPVLDIKPYIAGADAVSDSSVAWLNEEPFEIKEFSALPCACEKGDFLRETSGLDLLETARVQLATRKMDIKCQRLELDEEHKCGKLAFRTWRIYFTYSEEKVTVTDIESGYSSSELAPDAPDRYGDLELHRSFKCRFRERE